MIWKTIKQIKKFADSDKIDLSTAFINTVAHETIHKVLHEHVNLDASIDFDNIACEKCFKLYGKFTFKGWFGGFYEGVE